MNRHLYKQMVLLTHLFLDMVLLTHLFLVTKDLQASQLMSGWKSSFCD